MSEEKINLMEIKIKLQKDLDDKSNKLRIIIGNNNGGLTPDSIKNSLEYRNAKSDYNKAFASLRKFNILYPPEYFKKQKHGRN